MYTVQVRLYGGLQFAACPLTLPLTQIFILRQPARQNLRQKLAHVSWSLNAHSALFSYLTEAVMPMQEDSTDSPPPDWDAVEVVRNELVQREIDTQGQLLALMPLMK